MDADIVVVGAGIAGLVAAAEAADAGRQVLLVDQEGRAESGRPGLLEPRWPVPGRQPGAAQDGHQGLTRPGSSGLVRVGAVRPRRGPVAAPVGRGIPPLRRWRETRVAPRNGAAALPHRRLGRARGRPSERARQLGPALPPDLGHGTGSGRALRTAGARRTSMADGSPSPSGTRSTSSSWSRVRPSAYAAPFWNRRTSTGVGPAAARQPARSSAAPRRSSSPAVGSAATTTSSARPGRPASARRRSGWWRVCPRMSTVAC